MLYTDSPLSCAFVLAIPCHAGGDAGRRAGVETESGTMGADGADTYRHGPGLATTRAGSGAGPGGGAGLGTRSQPDIPGHIPGDYFSHPLEKPPRRTTHGAYSSAAPPWSKLTWWTWVLVLATAVPLWLPGVGRGGAGRVVGQCPPSHCPSLCHCTPATSGGCSMDCHAPNLDLLVLAASIKNPLKVEEL